MHRKPNKMIEVDKYILFKTDKESTAPFISKAMNEDDNGVYAGLLEDFDLQPLLCCIPNFKSLFFIVVFLNIYMSIE